MEIQKYNVHHNIMIILLLESIFVGFYILSIFLILQIFIPICMLLLFITGFLKHFLGYVLRIHEYYCSYKSNKKSSINHLLTDSIIEGVVVTIVALLLSIIIDIRVAIFITGIFLHLISEQLGLHDFFLKYRCYTEST